MLHPAAESGFVLGFGRDCHHYLAQGVDGDHEAGKEYFAGKALEEVDSQVAENRAVGVPSQADEEAGDLLFLDGMDDARGDVEVVAAEFLEVRG